MGLLADRLSSLRDRILTDPRFQRYASTSRILAPVARRHASQLFDLCAGFVYSQILAACVELDVFTHLEAGPLTSAVLAERLGLAPDKAQRLLEAAAALDLLEVRSGDRFGLGVHGAAILANPGIAAMIAHHRALYRDLDDPVALLRDSKGATQLSRYWAYATHQGGALADSDVAPYTALMSASQSLVAEQVLASFDFGPINCLLDVGGGDGTFLERIGTRHRHLRVKLFDLPAVADAARCRFERSTLRDRSQVFGGDFLTDDLPEGADAVSFVRVLHDHDDAPVARLLGAARRAIAPGGALLIAEPLAGTRGARRMGDAYFGFYLLAMRSGRPRTFGRLSQMLRQAGFDDVRRIKTPVPLQTSLILARAR